MFPVNAFMTLVTVPEWALSMVLFAMVFSGGVVNAAGTYNSAAVFFMQVWKSSIFFLYCKH